MKVPPSIKEQYKKPCSPTPLASAKYLKSLGLCYPSPTQIISQNSVFGEHCLKISKENDVPTSNAAVNSNMTVFKTHLPTNIYEKNGNPGMTHVNLNHEQETWLKAVVNLQIETAWALEMSSLVKQTNEEEESELQDTLVANLRPNSLREEMVIESARSSKLRNGITEADGSPISWQFLDTAHCNDSQKEELGRPRSAMSEIHKTGLVRKEIFPSPHVTKRRNSDPGKTIPVTHEELTTCNGDHLLFRKDPGEEHHSHGDCDQESGVCEDNRKKRHSENELHMHNEQHLMNGYANDVSGEVGPHECQPISADLMVNGWSGISSTASGMIDFD